MQTVFQQYIVMSSLQANKTYQNTEMVFAT